jgi:hypothetical protein
MKRWVMTLMIFALATGPVHAESWDDQWGLGLEIGAWKQSTATGTTAISISSRA